MSYGGYFYRMFLPRADGSAIAEPGPGAVFAAMDADTQEQVWIVNAWPEELGVAGNRAFVMSWEAPLCGICSRRHPTPPRTGISRTTTASGRCRRRTLLL